mmetsp:Transcript_6276/g.15910  ORF Transcript_6276/g.15910 Transcript_6276/m.15910 type:complete len:237 (-) Transcript_6276:2966-3676(-)
MAIFVIVCRFISAPDSCVGKQSQLGRPANPIWFRDDRENLDVSRYGLAARLRRMPSDASMMALFSEFFSNALSLGSRMSVHTGKASGSICTPSRSASRMNSCSCSKSEFFSTVARKVYSRAALSLSDTICSENRNWWCRTSPAVRKMWRRWPMSPHTGSSAARYPSSPAGALSLATMSTMHDRARTVAVLKDGWRRPFSKWAASAKEKLLLKEMPTESSSLSIMAGSMPSSRMCMQ